MSNGFFKIGLPELGFLLLLALAGTLGLIKGMGILGSGVGLKYSHSAFNQSPEGTNWIILVSLALFLFICWIVGNKLWDKHTAPTSRR